MSNRLRQWPLAHAMAVGPYRLAVWSQWLGHDIRPITEGNGVVDAHAAVDLVLDGPIPPA